MAPNCLAKSCNRSWTFLWVVGQFDTAGELAGFAAETFLKTLIGLPIDLGISIVWVMGLFGAFAEIHREQRRFTTAVFSSRAFPPPWVKLVCPAVGWGCLLLAMLIGIIRN